MSHVAGTGVGVLGGQVCRMRGAFPLHAQHRALRGPPRGFGIMRMCSSYLVSNHSYNLTCSQGETDAPRSRSSRSVDTRPDTRWLLSAHYWRTAVCLLAARKVCSPTRSDASKKRQCAFWCIRSVARRRDLCAVSQCHCCDEPPWTTNDSIAGT